MRKGADPGKRRLICSSARRSHSKAVFGSRPGPCERLFENAAALKQLLAMQLQSRNNKQLFLIFPPRRTGAGGGAEIAPSAPTKACPSIPQYNSWTRNCYIAN